MSARARILLADDHVLLLEAFRRMLEPAFDVVGTVPDGAALVEEALRLEPDLVVADVSMPRMNGLEAARRLRSRIARDLHDDASQRLALLAIELDQLQAPDLADQARALSGDLHRIAHQLHPASLDQLGLLPAARRFAAELGARHGVEIEVSSDAWPDDVPAANPEAPRAPDPSLSV